MCYGYVCFVFFYISYYGINFFLYIYGMVYVIIFFYSYRFMDIMKEVYKSSLLGVSVFNVGMRE